MSDGDNTIEELEEASQLENNGRLLVKLADRSKLGPFCERDGLVRRCLHFMGQDHDIILVGEHGSGKTAVLEDMACRIARSPGSHRCRELLESNASQLQVGCLYARHFEHKFAALVKKCAVRRVALIIDSVHLAIGAGSSGNDPYGDCITLASELAPRHKLRLVATTTPQGAKALERIRPEFMDRFVRVEVPPATVPKTESMMRALRMELEELYGTEIDEGMLTALADLCGRFIHYRALPGAAFELLRNLADSAEDRRPVIDEDLLFEYMADFTGLPGFMLDESQELRPDSVRAHLERFIFGQQKAVDEVARAVVRYKARLNEPGKPVSAFLLQGPSGTGKTELASVLARYLFGSDDKLMVYPMANYRGDKGHERLLGSPTPRAGEYFQSGKLLDDVRTEPFSVILLDEIDKAGSETLNGLFHILDEGNFVENFGRETYFSSSIVIMSTNVGMQALRRGEKPGFIDRGKDTERAENREDTQKALDDFFGEAFLNRATTVFFDPLDRETVEKVAGKTIKDLAADLPGLSSSKIKIRVCRKLFDRIVARGYDERYGARLMQRVVRELVVDPIAAFLSASPDTRGVTLSLNLDRDGGVSVRVRK